MSTFVFLVCMSQQFHAWGHMKRSELPKPVVALQVSSFVSQSPVIAIHWYMRLHARLNVQCVCMYTNGYNLQSVYKSAANTAFACLLS